LRRAGFTLEEATRNAACREGLFLVIDRQREEVDAGLLALCRRRRAQHDCFAVGRQHGSVGLTSDAPRLQGKRAPTPFDFLAGYLEHSVASFRAAPAAHKLPW